MEKYCVCLGGSNIVVDAEFQAITKKAILQCFEDGFKTFLCTGYGNWALFVASILRHFQKKGRDICIQCYIPDSFQANKYHIELLNTSYYDEVHILRGRTMLETDLFLLKKGTRLLAPKESMPKNALLLHAIEQYGLEVVLV